MMLDHVKLCLLTLVCLTCIGHDVCSAQSTCEGGEATNNTEYKVTSETGSYTGFVWVRPSDDINVVICNPSCRSAETGYSATKNDSHSTLTIESVTARDVGTWKIQDANNDTAAASSVCNLTLSDDTISTTTSSTPADNSTDDVDTVSTTTSSTPSDISTDDVDTVSTTTSSTPSDISTDDDDISTTPSTPVDTSTQGGTSSSMTTAKPEEPGTDPGLLLPLYLIIIIAVGAALIIAIIIIIICIVRWRRKCEKYGVQDAEKSYKAPKDDASPVQNLSDPHPVNGGPIETIDTTLATVPKDDKDKDIPREMVLSNGMLYQAPDLDEAGGMDETSLTASKEADLKENDDTDGPVCDGREDGESDREKDVATTEADAVTEPDETGPDHTGVPDDRESNTPIDLWDTGSNEATAIGSMFEGLGEPSEEMPQEQDVLVESDFPPPSAGESNEGKSDTRSDDGSDEDGKGASDNSVLDRLDESVLQELSALGDSDSNDGAGVTGDGDIAVYVPERA